MAKTNKNYPSPGNTLSTEPKQANFSEHPGHGSALRTAEEAGREVRGTRQIQITKPR